MQKLLFFFFTILFFSNRISAQQFSLKEFFSLKNMPLKQIDSLMAAKKFTRFDTVSSGLTFRFYGFSKQTGNMYNLKYLQLAIKADYSYPEMQYQTSDEKESVQWQQELTDEGYSKTIIEKAGETKITSFQKNKLTVSYSLETISGGTIILYSFKLTDSNSSETNLL